MKGLFFDDEPRFRTDEIITMIKNRRAVPGIVLSLILGLLAFFTGLDPLVVALILGIIARQLIRSEKTMKTFMPGILLSPVLFIPAGIILYSTKLNISQITGLGPGLVILVAAFVILTFIIVWYLGRSLGFTRNLRLLTATGSAVCGASAIAIVYPVLRATPDDMSKSLVSNILLGFFGLSLFVLALNQLPEVHYSVLAGLLLPQTGFVEWATGLFGNTDLALSVKALRVASLIVILLGISYLSRRKVFVPWYVVVFILLSAIFSFVLQPPAFLRDLSSFLLASALAAIGLNTSLFPKDSLKLFVVSLVPLVFMLGMMLVFWA
ncbi:MAG: putative sulfate exporter family transporter [Candidatus Micrarchaeota archaeon]|nr:putative sulfate exporter family transporter [Candidatus Micrarchaeota archaeon]